jgi:hypothetical protein
MSTTPLPPTYITYTINGQKILWNRDSALREEKWNKASRRMQMFATNQDFSEFVRFGITDYYHKSPPGGDQRFHLTVQLQTEEHVANKKCLVAHVYEVDDENEEHVSYVIYYDVHPYDDKKKMDKIQRT